MPFTTIALDRLIEQQASKPMAAGNVRRGPRLSKAFSEDDAALRQGIADEKTTEIVKSLEAEDVESCRVVNGIVKVGEVVEGNDAKDVANGEDGQGNLERDSEMDDFFDPQDSLSVRSSTDGENSFRLDRSLNLNTSASEFYDAWEELSSESGSQTASNDVETELRELRLSLLVEMEKRKQAEEQSNDIQSQWRRVCEQLSLVGLNLPEDPTLLKNQIPDDIGEELSRQINHIRSVSNSIGREEAKAELEPEMKAQLESKNFEIARLLDRLRYYEAVNHEMSQRNQETIETTRRARQIRKTRQRWIWGSILAAVTVGSAALVWSYIPTKEGLSYTDHT
nr:hypothetical protein CTI12_AA533660 [Tanacetum cinerariifolium]